MQSQGDQGHVAQSPSRPTLTAPASNSMQAWWKSCLNFSIFTFASPDLEGLYQAHCDAASSNSWALFSAAHILTSAFLALQRIFMATKPQLALRAHSWLVHVASAFICSAHLALMLLTPAFARQHRRAIRAAFLLGLTPLLPYSRADLLWMQYVTRGTNPSGGQLNIHSFVVENLVLVAMPLGPLSNPISPLVDMLVLTVLLMTNLWANRYICNLPIVPVLGALGSLSPLPMAAAQAVSEGMCIVASAQVQMPCGVLPPICDAVLAFWQVAAWWLTCHGVLAAELVARRAFLRTEQALAQVGPAYQAAALRWPFGNMWKVVEMGMTSFLLTVLAAGMMPAP